MLSLAGNTQSAVSDDQGRYSFTNLPAGDYKITISGNGFAPQTLTGTLNAGESRELASISLLATTSANVEVTADLHDIAEAQVQLEEKQRILGIVPNFYVSYDPHPVPLTPRQKYRLALRSLIDPVNITIDAAAAGVEHAEDWPQSWGQGAGAYGKRFAASYGNDLVDTMLGGAVLPSLFHQDPRYFYKGTGTKTSRLLYAIRSAVICKGDNGRWQANYSSFIADFASAGISNLYYPADVRDGFTLTVEDFLVNKASAAGQNIVQEFLIRHLTPHLPQANPIQP